MTALGHLRRFDDVPAMSGLPPIATELRTLLEVRFVPTNEPALRERAARGTEPVAPMG